MEKFCLANIIQELKHCSTQTDNIIDNFNVKTEVNFSEWFASITELVLDVKNGVIKDKEVENGKIDSKVPKLNTFLDREQKVGRNFAILMSEMKKGHLHEKKALVTSSEVIDKEIEVISKEKDASVNVYVISKPSTHNSPVHELHESAKEDKNIKDYNLSENVESSEKNSPLENCRFSPLKLRSGKTSGKESKKNSSDVGKNDNLDLCFKTPDARTLVIDSSTHTVSVLKNNPKCRSVIFAAGKQSKRKSSELNETETKESSKRQKNNNRLASAQSTEKHCKKNQELNGLLKTSLYQGASFIGSQNQKSSVSGLTSSFLKPPAQNPKKEVQLMKNIKKKEEKANENLKKVMSLRQMKVQENKRKRQEKMEKTLQQRLKIEKEKEERLKNHKNSVEVVYQKVLPVKQLSVKLKRLASITDKQENSSKKQVKNQQKTSPRENANLEETFKPSPLQSNITVLKDHSNERVLNKTVNVSSNSKGAVLSSNSSNSHTPGLNTTYAADNSENTTKTDMKKINGTISASESFVNYEINKEYVSDDDEEEEDKQPIPSWAKGIALKNALLTQHYHPPDLNALFGSTIDNPDLTKIFGSQKKYKKRTSSAIWNSPNRPIFT